MENKGYRASHVLRRWLPVGAVAVAVAVALTDWPFGWSFWVDHPLTAAFAAGLVLLLLTGSVVDAYLRRREAKRWSSLGRVAASEFFIFFDLARMSVAHLLGFDFGARVSPRIEIHVTGARERAAGLIPTGLSTSQAYELAHIRAKYVDEQQERLPRLVRDEDWSDKASVALMELTLDLGQAIARWAGIFAILGDDERFRHVTESVRVIDEIRAVIEHLQDLPSKDAATQKAASEPSIASLVSHWTELTDALAEEDRYWEAQLHSEMKTPMPRRSEFDDPKPS
jgi:hypothetical protein